MIVARVQKFVRGNVVQDIAVVPNVFWWARGHEALEQNWSTGDFETWIDQRVHLKAYGVTFRQSDIEAMVPSSTLTDSAARTVSKSDYVHQSRLQEIADARKGSHDLTRLMRLCEELNVAHINECHMTVAMLVRAITDHIPPVFGCNNFAAVAAQADQSFKKSMSNLQASLRNIADSFLHKQIRSQESLPNEVQVNFAADLDVLLAEVVRRNTH